METGDNALIGGFIVTGAGSKRILLRAIGPSLADAKIANPLPDPFLDVRNANGEPLASNNNWKDDPKAAQVSHFGLAPKNDLESALYLVLPPGAYTAIVSGNGGSSGVGLVEVYGATNDFNVRAEQAP